MSKYHVELTIVVKVQSSMSPMVRRPYTIEIILLGLLATQPQHGYELEQTLLHSGGLEHLWKVRQNQLYAILQKFEIAGLLTSTPEPQIAGPIRHVYKITDSGLALFETWATTPVTHPRQLRQEFLARLYFAMRMGPGYAVQLLQDQQKVCQAWLKRVDQELTDLDPGEVFRSRLLHFRRENINAIQTWLSGTTEAISERSVPVD